MTMPPPLSLAAAARYKVDIPNDVPNSTIRFAPIAHAVTYMKRPCSADTGR